MQMKRFLNRISSDYIIRQLMKGTMSGRDTVIRRLDPRVLIVWQLFFSVAPFFVRDLKVLTVFFLLVSVVAFLSHVTLLIFCLFVLGVIEKFVSLLVIARFFGGNSEAVLPALILMLKFATVSLAAVAVYTTMDPEKLALALEWFHFPSWLVFSVSLGYRMLPVVTGEYAAIVALFRSRTDIPEPEGIGGRIRWLACHIRILFSSFYPVMLNTAKRIRVVSEALELRGFYAGRQDPASKKLRFEALRFSPPDSVFLGVSVLWCVAGGLL